MDSAGFSFYLNRLRLGRNPKTGEDVMIKPLKMFYNFEHGNNKFCMYYVYISVHYKRRLFVDFTLQYNRL